MHLVGLHFRAQGGIHPLMTLDCALAFKLFGHDGGVPVAPVTIERDVFTRKVGRDKVPNLVCIHIKSPKM